jgi:hypothetical protein
MEFDIGTLIYILITIVAVIAGVVGNKKKPAGSQPSPGKETGATGFFEKLEEQLSGFIDETKGQSMADESVSSFAYDQEEYQTETGFYKEEVDLNTEEFTPSVSQFADFEGVYDPEVNDNLDLIISEVERTTDDDAIKIIELDENYHADYNKLVKDFDLGTAVIYSAIINRKEY